MAGDRTRFQEAMNRGYSYASSGQWEQAIQEYRAALKEFPGDISARTSLALALHGAGRLREALELYEGLWHELPTDLAMLRRVAELQEALGDGESAAASYRRLATMLGSRGRPREAFEAWRKAAELNPREPIPEAAIVWAEVLPEPKAAGPRPTLEEPVLIEGEPAEEPAIESETRLRVGPAEEIRPQQLVIETPSVPRGATAAMPHPWEPEPFPRPVPPVGGVPIPALSVAEQHPRLASTYCLAGRTGEKVTDEVGVLEEVRERFGDDAFTVQPTRDEVPTLWVSSEKAREVLEFLRTGVKGPYRTLFDLTAIDERTRFNRQGQPPADFSVVYHLLSYDRNADVRVKVALRGEYPTIRTVTDLWPSANWYEREVWDMFGIVVEGHPNPRRILMPPEWKGHPLRKDYPARATEKGPFLMSREKEQAEQEALRFRPEDWGLARHSDDEEFMFLNVGPQHPGTHGPFRIVLQLDGEEIIDAVPDIGYHHRGAEKMGERQSWHTYVPYTDRVDYLSGVMNELAYLTSLERLAGIQVPDRAKVIRVMMAELFRIANHLVFMGTFAQDVGQMSPVFYTFTDRERVLEIVEAVCGARMHPVWFRIGGVAQDLPNGWDRLVKDFISYFPPRLDEYDRTVMRNRIFKARTQGVGKYTLDQAVEWGVTGPGLRACGLEWDFRKKRPYSGYDQFEFDIPTATHGDSYDRAVIHMEEMRQSLRIIRQCVDNMPAGPYKSDHPLATPPIKRHTMQDIETLITHFLNVSWGPVMPVGESSYAVEASKGCNSYYLVSDGSTISYRTRIRTPSFAHLQMLPLMARGHMVADLVAILGSIDFVLADVDR